MEIRHPDSAREGQLLHLWEQTFGTFDGFWGLFLKSAFSPDNCLCIPDGERVAAALYWFDCDYRGSWAYIFAVATHPDCRGKGLCRKLMEKTLETLRARGCQGALLVPADGGLRKMYGKMGFRDCTGLTELLCSPGDKPVSLRKVSSWEYSRLRKECLPQGSVCQAGAMMTLLEAGGTVFCAGEGILAAVEEGRVLEYLGDPAAIPAVLNTLGMGRTAVRIPGKAQPFAMGIPLQEEVALPAYFAFALD